MLRRFVFSLLCGVTAFLSPHSLFSQSETVSDPAAVSIAARSLNALTGGQTIADVTLTGTATWDRTQTGAITLKALGAREGRIDLSLQDGTRTEIRDAQTGTPSGQWSTPKASGTFAYHNCWTEAAWFFPALSSLRGGPNVVLSYVGQESRDGVTVQHIRSYALDDPLLNTKSSPLSRTDFYINAATFLPVAIEFNVHPDGNEISNLRVEIRFSSYQSVAGVSVPMHIQRFQQGNLIEDIVLSAASSNSGLTSSTFAINN